jgi:hypothetical protein
MDEAGIVQALADFRAVASRASLCGVAIASTPRASVVADE